MKIINTEKFFISPPSIDRLIQKKIKEGIHPDEYNIRVSIDNRSDINGDNVYIINYKSLLDTIVNDLISKSITLNDDL